MPARNVLPKPYTKPHPPMWVAAGSPSTFQKAAQMGLGVLCFTMGGPEPLKPLIELYKKEIEHAEPVGDYVNDNIMVTTQLLCLEDGARVRAIAPTLSMSYQNSLVFRYLDTFPRPEGIPVWPDLIPEPTAAEVDERIRAGAGATYGAPDEVAGALELYEAAGIDQVVFGLLSSTMDRELATEIVETFGTHVLPQFDKDPVAPHHPPPRVPTCVSSPTPTAGELTQECGHDGVDVQPRGPLGDTVRRGAGCGVPRRGAGAAHAPFTRRSCEPDRARTARTWCAAG